MEIINFDRLRIGSNFPHTLDVSPMQHHESQGIQASFSTVLIGGENGLQNAELRQSKDGRSISLFLYYYDGSELPNGWNDSQVLWELHANNQDQADFVEGAA